MSFLEELKEEVSTIFKTKWEMRDGTTIPEAEDVALGNVGVKLKGTVLYADLAESTAMVNKKTQAFSAEIYKTYLITVCRIIRDNGGEITAFDGDRAMAVFIGDTPNTSAAKTALKINWAVNNVINPELKLQYPKTDFQVRQSVGIDTSDMLIARTGIRGSNDLVWVGRAANYAAKLCSLRKGDQVTWITEDVYNALTDSAKVAGNGSPMWEKFTWSAYNSNVYSSTYWWSIE